MSSIAPAHHNSGHASDDWITPKWLIDKLGDWKGFDLDPCASVTQPWPCARNSFSVLQDGLLQKWQGCVWMNPPYGQSTAHWLRKLAEHGNGVALIFARTETKMFFDHVWPTANSVLFVEGRLTFHYPDGKKAKANSGGPSVLIGYGSGDYILRRNQGIGRFLEVN